MRGEVMGIPEDYEDDVERRRTHPLLMPKMESEKISLADGEVLEKVAIVTPVKPPAKKSNKGILRGKSARLILPGVKPTAKRRSVLSEDKYAPGDTPRWKHVSARFPALYQALLDEPDKAVRKSMYGIDVKRAG